MDRTPHHLAIDDRAFARQSAKLSGTEWLLQPSFMLVLLISLIAQAGACHDAMAGLDIGWTWAWLLLPVIGIIEAVLRQLRLVVHAVLVHFRPAAKEAAISVLRVRSATTLIAAKRAAIRRARDSIP